MLAALSNITAADVVQLASSVVSIAAVVAAITPTPADDTALAAVKKVINLLAFNVLNAKNKD